MVDRSKKIECNMPGDPVTILVNPGKYTYKGISFCAVDGNGNITTPMPGKSFLLDEKGVGSHITVSNGVARRNF